jgi:hypothetical protein
MLQRLALVVAVVGCASPALAQSSAAFPDPPRAGTAATAPSSAPPVMERPAVESPPARDPSFAMPAAHFGAGGPSAPAFGVPAAPRFESSFLPTNPAHDAPEPSASTSSPTLLIVGAVVVALPYATGLGVAAAEGFDNGSGWLAAPVAGPWLSLSGRRDPCAGASDKKEFDSDVGKCVAEPLVRGMLVLDGVLQATGAVMMFIGATSGGRPKPRREPPPLLAAPTPMGRNGYGLAVAGGF